VISPNQLQHGNQAFLALVTSQVQRATLELRKLEAMLEAGLVEKSVLAEFRKAVDQIRQTSWNVHQSLEGGGH
jgi:hypothetical protein